ncbi:MAG TPA: hypothetical protein VHE78_12715, partial [Gemmatimonadaceae bacterium]|nr:hypothetical protein [Gemmatimonadaceae bacterium]
RAWSAVGEPPEVLKRLASTWINRSVNIEKARQLLGFEPVALEWGLDTTAADLLGNGLRQYDRDDRKA